MKFRGDEAEQSKVFKLKIEFLLAWFAPSPGQKLVDNNYKQQQHYCMSISVVLWTHKELELEWNWKRRKSSALHTFHIQVD